MWQASRSSSRAIPRIAWARGGGWHAGQSFDRLAIGRGVADRRVAGQRFHVVDRAFVRAADERPLDAAVLIAEVNLQVKHVLAVALEAKAARLDHAGMHRADGDFVNLAPLDLKVVGHAGQNLLARRAAPGIVARPIRVVIAERLEPGMAARDHAPLLGDLALEVVGLRTIGRQRRELVAVQVGAPAARAVPRSGRPARHTGGCRRRRAAGRRTPPAASSPSTLRDDRLAELGEAQAAALRPAGAAWPLLQARESLQ